MSRIFDNLHNLPRPIISARLESLDGSASCSTYYYEKTNDVGMPTGEVNHYVEVSSILDDDQVNGMLVDPETAEETQALADHFSARYQFLNLPNWALWSAQDVEDNITAGVLSGQTQGQVDAYIDATVVSLAGARTAFKQLATSLIYMRAVLVGMGKALVFIRQLAVRFGR